MKKMFKRALACAAVCAAVLCTVVFTAAVPASFAEEAAKNAELTLTVNDKDPYTVSQDINKKDTFTFTVAKDDEVLFSGYSIDSLSLVVKIKDSKITKLSYKITDIKCTINGNESTVLIPKDTEGGPSNDKYENTWTEGDTLNMALADLIDRDKFTDAEDSSENLEVTKLSVTIEVTEYEVEAAATTTTKAVTTAKTTAGGGGTTVTNAKTGVTGAAGSVMIFVLAVGAGCAALKLRKEK